MIGAPRGRCATYPVYVYSPEQRRKVYVGSCDTLREAQLLEQRHRLSGSPMAPRKRQPAPPSRKPHGRVIGYAVNEVSGCWIWQGSLTSKGYGRLSAGLLAHRLVYEQHKGPIPVGLEIDHLCFNTRCVNPDHLDAVTGDENKRRAAAFRRQTIEVKP